MHPVKKAVYNLFNGVIFYGKYTKDLKFKAVKMYLEDKVRSTTIAKEIISYKLSTSLGLEFVEETIKDACSVENIGVKNELIIHSDQGFHYTSHVYKELLKSKNIVQSMSRKSNCYDNACIENFFGHLKTELIYLNHFKTKEELFTAIDEYIYWYNHSRYQIKENRTPIELRCAA